MSNNIFIDTRFTIQFCNQFIVCSKIDNKIIIKSLEEIRKILPESDYINTDKLLKKHHKMIRNAPPELLSELALPERESVRDFILDSKFPAKDVFSPFVIQSLVRSIEEKLNDN